MIAPAQRLLIGAILLAIPSLPASPRAHIELTKPLPRAHAHNDYEHNRPPLDAFDNGFCSVEADVWLVDGKLLVAHDLKDIKPERTLESLYLEPLRNRVRANGGRVYKNGPGFTLLVDIKSEAESTYSRLREVLSGFREMLTRWEAGERPGAVTVIVSGNRPIKMMAAESSRLAAVDGRIPDLHDANSVRLIPLISDNWRSHFTWRGIGPISPEEREKLRSIVQKAHGQRRRIRFWATPDRIDIWRELYDAGVDLINTDDLPGLRAFLLSQPQTPPASGALSVS